MIIKDREYYVEEYNLEWSNCKYYAWTGRYYREKRFLLNNELIYHNYYYFDKDACFDKEIFDTKQKITYSHFDFSNKSGNIIELKEEYRMDKSATDSIMSTYIRCVWRNSVGKHYLNSEYGYFNDLNMLLKMYLFDNEYITAYNVGEVSINDNIKTFAVVIDESNDVYFHYVSKKLLFFNFKDDVLKSILCVAKILFLDDSNDFIDTSIDDNGILFTKQDGYSEHISMCFRSYREFVNSLKTAPISYIKTSRYYIDDDGHVRFMGIINKK